MSLKKLISDIEQLELTYKTLEREKSLCIQFNHAKTRYDKNSYRYICDIFMGIKWEKNNCIYDSFLLSLLFPSNKYLLGKWNSEQYKIIDSDNEETKKMKRRKNNILRQINAIRNAIYNKKEITSTLARDTLCSLQTGFTEENLGYKPEKIEFSGNFDTPWKVYNAFNKELKLKMSMNSSCELKDDDIIKSIINHIKKYHKKKLSYHLTKWYNLLISNIAILSIANSKQIKDNNILLTGRINTAEILNFLKKEIITEKFANIIKGKDDEDINNMYEKLKDTVKTYIPTKLFLHAIVYKCTKEHQCALIRCGDKFYKYDGMEFDSRRSYIPISNTCLKRLVNQTSRNIKNGYDITFIYWEEDNHFFPFKK